MTDTTPTDDESTTTLTDPRTLRDREDVPFETDTRSFETEKFEALRERYDTIAGVVQVGLTNDDGDVLLWGAEDVAPPGGEVETGADWAATARRSMEALTGQTVVIDRPLLVEWTEFRHAADETASFPAPSVHFAASLVDPDPAFLDDPTVPADYEHPMFEDDPVLDWYSTVPDTVHQNHAHHVERYLE